MTRPRIAVIVGSTRATRFADKPAQWMLSKAKARGDWDVELVDLRDYDLPLFDEVASNLWAPSQGEVAQAWQSKIGGFDGYIFVVAEYNRSITGALKNALDHAYVEWNRKPMTAIAYGALGGARAMEHLRTIAVELQMVPCRSAVHLGGADFFATHPMGSNGEIAAVEGNLKAALEASFADMEFWLTATMAAKSAKAA
jgi:NAD(P)H-dependent FMN reductase